MDKNVKIHHQVPAFFGLIVSLVVVAGGCFSTTGGTAEVSGWLGVTGDAGSAL